MAGNDTETTASKKYKRSRFSCDFCKARKVRCDSSTSLNGTCTNCTNHGKTCTQEDLKLSLGGTNKTYVENLEAAAAQLEQENGALIEENAALVSTVRKLRALLNKMLPGVDVARALSEEGSPTSIPSDAESRRSPSVQVPRNDTIHAIQKPGKELEHLAITHNHKVFGKASFVYVIRTAFYIREYHMQNPREPPQMASWKRAQFYKPQAWQISSRLSPAPSTYVFPEHDLLLSLATLYFDNVNLYYPLLHQPSFDLDVASGRHFNDRTFARVVLLVCALGSRFSTDRDRVNLGTYIDNDQTAGWAWYRQVAVATDEKSNLELVQVYALLIQYKPMVSQLDYWNDIGFALRLAIDIGAHRKSMNIGLAGKVKEFLPTKETELRKRAFWVLLTLDQELAFILGRPATIFEEDFDQELLIECDDEFWEHSRPSCYFQQPPWIPSKAAYFNALLGLRRIQGHVMRELYFTKRRPTFGLDDPSSTKSDEDILASLDSAMNSAFSSIPAHLNWESIAPVFDPTNPFHRQAACLHAAYHQLQIFIHHPFIPTPSVESPIAFPSLSICVGAARACIKIARETAKFSWGPTVNFHLTLSISSVIIFLYRWSRKGFERTEAGIRDIEHIKIIMEVIQKDEVRLGTGRLWDKIQVFLQMDDINSTERCTTGIKRARATPAMEAEGASFAPIFLTGDPQYAPNADGSHSNDLGFASLGYTSENTLPNCQSSFMVASFPEFGADALGMYGIDNDWNLFLESFSNGWEMEQTPPQL